jgi:hypothetical protein
VYTTVYTKNKCKDDLFFTLFDSLWLDGTVFFLLYGLVRYSRD